MNWVFLQSDTQAHLYESQEENSDVLHPIPLILSLVAPLAQTELYTCSCQLLSVNRKSFFPHCIEFCSRAENFQ